MRALEAVFMELFRNGPVTRLPIGVAPGRRTGLRISFMGMLGALILCATAMAAPPPGPQAAGAAALPALPSGYVGSDMCATCHQDVAANFATNPHTRVALMHGKAGITCENCHGPGEAHVEGGGDVTKIFAPAKATPQQIDAKCLSCHAGTHPNFLRSPHAKAGVSCISCHSIHGGNTQLPGQTAAKAVLQPVEAPMAIGQDYREALLKAPQPALCYQCHTDVKPAFNMPFHHKVPEGLVKCTDCHNVHGSFLPNNLRSTVDQNMICTKCHMEKRGPFVFEHMAVKAEGCLACHTPHGSQNARLLNMPSINELCLQCHGQVAADTVHGMSLASSDSVPCTSCHTYIHGSNMNAAFLR